jgi:hypothetical protein
MALDETQVPRVSQSFCCHVFTRQQLVYPIASLAGLEEPAVAIRFSPVVYKRISISSVDTKEENAPPAAAVSVLPSKYRLDD